MSSKTTFAVIGILVIFLVGAYVVTQVPLIESETDTLVDRSTGSLEDGYFKWYEFDFEGGEVSYAFTTLRRVDAFIMTEAQFYGFRDGNYVGSLDAIEQETSGTLTCKIDSEDTYFFIMYNSEETRTVSIVREVIKHKPPKITILENLTK